MGPMIARSAFAYSCSRRNVGDCIGDQQQKTQGSNDSGNKDCLSGNASKTAEPNRGSEEARHKVYQHESRHCMPFKRPRWTASDGITTCREPAPVGRHHS
jgi:hypothetical protein